MTIFDVIEKLKNITIDGGFYEISFGHDFGQDFIRIMIQTPKFDIISSGSKSNLEEAFNSIENQMGEKWETMSM